MKNFETGQPFGVPGTLLRDTVDALLYPDIWHLNQQTALDQRDWEVQTGQVVQLVLGIGAMLGSTALARQLQQHMPSQWQPMPDVTPSSSRQRYPKPDTPLPPTDYAVRLRQKLQFLQQTSEQALQRALQQSHLASIQPSKVLNAFSTAPLQRVRLDTLEAPLVKTIDTMKQRLPRMQEQSVGDKTSAPPIPVSHMSLALAMRHWLWGQGQSLQLPFSALNLQHGEFRETSDLVQLVKVLQHQAKSTQNSVTRQIRLNKQPFEFPDLNTMEGQVFGNIVVNIEGVLKVQPSGAWQFKGYITPSLTQDPHNQPLYGDTFDFDPSPHRPIDKAVIVDFVHRFPGTSYNIHLTRAWVPVVYSKGY